MHLAHFLSLTLAALFYIQFKGRDASMSAGKGATELAPAQAPAGQSIATFAGLAEEARIILCCDAHLGHNVAARVAEPA